MRQYKKDFEDCKKRLSKAEYEYAFEKNKEMLIGAHLDEQKSSTNREKLLKQGEMLSDTTYKLKDSVKVMHDTLQISNNATIQLTNQTVKMRTNTDRLVGMQTGIGTSQKKISNIMTRIIKNKLTLIITLCVIFLIGIVAVIVHFTTK